MKRFFKVIAVIVLVLVCLAIALSALIRNESFARWVTDYAIRRSGVDVLVEGIEGTFKDGEILISSVEWERDGLKISMERVFLKWGVSSFFMLDRLFIIERLVAGKIEIHAGSGGGEVVLPDSIELPFRVNILEGLVEALEVHYDEKSFYAKDILFSFVCGRRDFIFELKDNSTEWGRLVGLVRIGYRRPFRLRGKFSFAGEIAEVSLDAKLALGGSLLEPSVAVAGSTKREEFDIKAILSPWDEGGIVRQLNAKVDGFNPAHYSPGIPDAGVVLFLEAGPAEGREYGYGGVVRAVNKNPGSFDSGLMPLKEATFKCLWDSKTLVLEDIRLHTGEKGIFEGRGGWTQGSLALSLEGKNLYSESFYSGIPGFIFSASMESIYEKELMLKALLRQDEYNVVARVSLENRRLSVESLKAEYGKGLIDLSGEMSLDSNLPFVFAGTVTGVDISGAGDFPETSLRGDISAEGNAASGYYVKSEFVIFEDILFEESVHARGSFVFSQQGFALEESMVSCGRNSVSLDGSFKNNYLFLDWDADFMDLSVIRPALSGRGLFTGVLKGEKDSLSSDVEGVMREIVFDEYSIDEIRVSGVAGWDRREAFSFVSDETSVVRGSNILQAAFDYSRGSISADWRFEGEDVSEINNRFSGRFSASGTAAGRLQSPDISMKFTGSQAGFMEYLLIGGITGTIFLKEGLKGVFEVQLDCEDIVLRETFFNKAGLEIKGTGPRHTVVIEALGKGLGVGASFEGGLDSELNWEGTVYDLSVEKGYRGRVKKPFFLRAGRWGFDAEGILLDSEAGLFTIRGISYTSSGWESQGEASGIPSAFLTDIFKYEGTGFIEHGLRLGGRWGVRAGRELNGYAGIYRESGDVEIVRPGGMKLGITGLDIALQFENSRISGQASLEGEKAGKLELLGDAILTDKGNFWGFAKGAPLSIVATGQDIPLSILARPSGLSYEIGGMVSFQGFCTGSIDNPKFQGTVSGEDLFFSIEKQGLLLKDGHLSGTFVNDRLSVDKMEFSGRRGGLSATGHILPGRRLEGELKFLIDGLEVLSRPDGLLVLSGTCDIRAGRDLLSISGDLRADRGLLMIPAGARYVLSRDIVVSGWDTAETVTYSEMDLLRLNLTVDAGDEFFLKINGLESYLSGSLKIVSSAGGIPEVHGTLNVAKGLYRVYGREMVIERGLVTFNGPAGNPFLDVEALRKNMPVEPGVRVTGSVEFMETTLVSYPDVPDIDKISWLFLGRPAGDAAKTDAALLIAASEVLLAGSDAAGLQTQLAQVFGLDEITLLAEEHMADTVVRVGKRLTDTIYVAYERSMAGMAALVKINYNFHRNWTLQAASGEDQEMGLFYKIDF